MLRANKLQLVLNSHIQIENDTIEGIQETTTDQKPYNLFLFHAQDEIDGALLDFISVI